MLSSQASQAAEVICLAYCGYRCAVSAALENDFVSSVLVPLVTFDACGEFPMRLAIPDA